jgi:CRISPR/Cas system-associated endoribonuclease Cas2
MALYLISYDIKENNSFEYQPLWDRLKEWAAKRVLYSEWVVDSDVGQAKNIYDDIAPLLSMNDGLLVQEMTKNAAWDKLKISDSSYYELLENARG